LNEHIMPTTSSSSSSIGKASRASSPVPGDVTHGEESGDDGASGETPCCNDDADTVSGGLWDVLGWGEAGGTGCRWYAEHRAHG
jgi:hypothetical protein